MTRPIERRLRNLEEPLSPQRKAAFVVTYGDESADEAFRRAGAQPGDVIFHVVRTRRSVKSERQDARRD
jgi:hypothetical protein